MANMFREHGTVVRTKKAEAQKKHVMYDIYRFNNGYEHFRTGNTKNIVDFSHS